MIKMLTVIVIILLGWLILISYVPEHQLQIGFEKIWNAVQTASIVSISLVFLTVFGALCWLAWVGYSHGIIWHSEARIRRAQADGEELHANLIITTVAPVDASLLVFGKKYSGEHAMDLKRHLSSLSFSSEVAKDSGFDENDNEKESEAR